MFFSKRLQSCHFAIKVAVIVLLAVLFTLTIFASILAFAPGGIYRNGYAYDSSRLNLLWDTVLLLCPSFYIFCVLVCVGRNLSFWLTYLSLPCWFLCGIVLLIDWSFYADVLTNVESQCHQVVAKVSADNLVICGYRTADGEAIAIERLTKIRPGVIYRKLLYGCRNSYAVSLRIIGTDEVECQFSYRPGFNPGPKVVAVKFR